VTRGRVCNLLVQVLLDLASAVTLVSKSRRTRDHISLSHLRLGSLFIASHDSEGYGGGILTRLHTGFPNSQLNYCPPAPHYTTPAAVCGVRCAVICNRPVWSRSHVILPLWRQSRDWRVPALLLRSSRGGGPCASFPVQRRDWEMRLADCWLPHFPLLFCLEPR
jgi:hypothetical protein